MKMVGHQYVSVDSDAENLQSAPQSLYKTPPIVIVAKNRTAIIASAGHTW
jgi:hypothetical protein